MSDRVHYRDPIPSRASRESIFSFAEEQREKTGLKNGFDLAKLVRKNNGEISYINYLDEDQTDAIIVKPDGSFTIRLSAHTGALRDNFTIAHEIGHLLLHWPMVKATGDEYGMRATRRIDNSNEDLRRCEWEANWFASAFLMPAKEFEDAYKVGNAAECFGVTQSAVKVRAKILGIDGSR